VGHLQTNRQLELQACAPADAALGVYLHLERLGVDGDVMYTDDTLVRILSCLKEDEETKGAHDADLWDSGQGG
jgi:hypothetical protein